MHQRVIQQHACNRRRDWRRWSVSRSQWNGFTLVELLVAVGLFVLVFTVVMLFGVRFIEVGARARTMRSVTENAAAALDRVLFEARNGQSLYIPTSVFGVAAGQLSIQTARNLPSGETRTYTDFFLEDGVLAVKREGRGPEAITTDDVRVTRFELTNVSAGEVDAVRVEVEVEQGNVDADAPRQASVTMVGTGVFRNP